ncbi:MAG: hypothetical protein EBR67_03690 [Proteobacteria bacterium]|nr:hypothetical protein [Pseudomonadota bacterium]
MATLNFSNFNPFAFLFENTTNQTNTNSTDPLVQINNTQPVPLLNQANSDSSALVNSAKQFYQAAVTDGYTYQRTDPTNSKGMDCVTGPWNFLKNYLTKEDFAKLEPLKDYAYVNKGTTAERTAGFSGAIEKAGLGKGFKVDEAYVNSLKGKSSEEINKELAGKMFTYSGTNDKTGKGEGHVAIISRAWKDEQGNVKFEILGPHYFNKSVEEGNNSGIGTDKKDYNLADYLKPNKNLTLATFNADVIQRAEQANNPASRNNVAANVGALVFKEMKKELANV